MIIENLKTPGVLILCVVSDCQDVPGYIYYHDSPIHGFLHQNHKTKLIQNLAKIGVVLP